MLGEPAPQFRRHRRNQVDIVAGLLADLPHHVQHHLVLDAVAIARGIFLGQTKFNLHIRRNARELRDDGRSIRVEQPEVAVDHLNGTEHLLI